MASSFHDNKPSVVKNFLFKLSIDKPPWNLEIKSDVLYFPDDDADMVIYKWIHFNVINHFNTVELVFHRRVIIVIITSQRFVHISYNTDPNLVFTSLYNYKWNIIPKKLSHSYLKEKRIIGGKCGTFSLFFVNCSKLNFLSKLWNTWTYWNYRGSVFKYISYSLSIKYRLARPVAAILNQDCTHRKVLSFYFKH